MDWLGDFYHRLVSSLRKGKYNFPVALGSGGRIVIFNAFLPKLSDIITLTLQHAELLTILPTYRPQFEYMHDPRANHVSRSRNTYEKTIFPYL